MYYTIFFLFCLFLFFSSVSLSISLTHRQFPLSTHFSYQTTFPRLSCIDPSLPQHSLVPNETHPKNKSSHRTNVKSGVSVLSSTSTAFGTAASNANLGNTGNGHIDDAVRQQALADEEAAMNQYKVLLLVYPVIVREKLRYSFHDFNIHQQAKVQSPTGGLSTNPFLSSAPNNVGQPIVDLFGAGAQPVDSMVRK